MALVVSCCVDEGEGGELVAPAAAPDQLACRGLDDVVEMVVPGAAPGPVPALLALDEVVAGAATDLVVARGALQLVAALPAQQEVAHHVVGALGPRPACQQVGPTETSQLVVAAAAHQVSGPSLPVSTSSYAEPTSVVTGPRIVSVPSPVTVPAPRSAVTAWGAWT